jgi:hypothetical protein
MLNLLRNLRGLKFAQVPAACLAPGHGNQHE